MCVARDELVEEVLVPDEGLLRVAALDVEAINRLVLDPLVAHARRVDLRTCHGGRALRESAPQPPPLGQQRRAQRREARARLLRCSQSPRGCSRPAPEGHRGRSITGGARRLLIRGFESPAVSGIQTLRAHPGCARPKLRRWSARVALRAIARGLHAIACCGRQSKCGQRSRARHRAAPVVGAVMQRGAGQ